MIRACFADNAELPITCNHDTGEVWNCTPATQGTPKDACPHWQPQRAIDLALDILGGEGMMQMSMFTGEERKAEGLAVIEERHGDFLETMRKRAREIAAEKGTVCSDDLRQYAACWGIEPAHPNAWGGIFRGSEWECTGFKKSTLPSNHARLVRVWRLKK